MDVKFPKRREDGTFSFVACFATSSKDNAGTKKDVSEWLLQWVEKHEVTTKEILRKNEVFFEDSKYYDQFSAPPCVVSVKDGELWIRFDGIAKSSEWKDWFIMIVNALLKTDLLVEELIRCISDEDIL